MSGTLAGTIQGESNGTTASKFAVATTIYNRMISGNFPGGSNPDAIVNAPFQYTGHSDNPDSDSQTFAQAIRDGTLGNYGTIGNATSFRTAGSDTRIGRSDAPNIGGNQFSDVDNGSPSSNFIAPQYNPGAPQPSDPNLSDPNQQIAQVPSTENTGDVNAPFATPLDQGGATLGMPGLGIPGMTVGKGGGLVYASKGQQEANVQGVNKATSAILAGVPDVATAINNAGQIIGNQISSQVGKIIASAEAVFGNGLVMVFAIVIFLAGIWLLIPRETKQKVYSSAATAAKAVA